MLPPKTSQDTNAQSIADVGVTSYTSAEYSSNWALGKINAEDAWQTSTGANITVAVLDTGVDLQHSDLDDNLWTNTGEIAGDGIDNDGNGYVDDVHGYNFSSRGAASNPDDTNGHGTHVAGIIAAEANQSGVVGVAPDADIMAVKVLGGSGSGSWSDVAAGIDYAVENGAKIINMSLGGAWAPPNVKAAVGRAQDAGVIIVAAAGNSRSDQASNPAALTKEFDNIISVAASTKSDKIAGFSNYSIDGTTVDVAAPGDSIRSTTPNDKYGGKSGTSMAAPVVAGAAAVIWAAKPSLNYTEVIDLIESTVSTLASLAKPIATNGVINLGEAIRQLNLLDGDPVNEAPTLALNSQVSELAENTDASGILLAELSIADDGLGVNMLKLVSGDVDAFEIRDGGLYLRDGVTLDFETQDSYTVVIAVDDEGLGNGAEDTVTYTLNLTDVDETPPTDGAPTDPVDPPESINFSEATFVDFQRNRRDKGDHSVSEDGNSLHLASNSWEAMLGDFTVTKDTILSFDFSAQVQGEVHGVMFTNGSFSSKKTTFQLFGTNNWGHIRDYNTYDGSGETVRFDIAVGEYITGDFDRVVFFLDDDRDGGGDSTFSNVVLSDGTEETPVENTDPTAVNDGPFQASANGTLDIAIATLLENDIDADGDALTFNGLIDVDGLSARVKNGVLSLSDVKSDVTLTYQISDGRGGVSEAEIFVKASETPDETPVDHPDQIVFSDLEIVDFRRQDKGDHTLSEDGKTMWLESQAWQSVILDTPIEVTADTMLSFSFAAKVQGEIHAVMFTNGQKMSKNKAFQLFGTQDWGHDTYRTYDGSGETFDFDIAVGEHFTGTFDRLVFLTDDDKKVGADSVFSNVVLTTQAQDNAIMSAAFDGDAPSILPPYEHLIGDGWL